MENLPTSLFTADFTPVCKFFFVYKILCSQLARKVFEKRTPDPRFFHIGMHLINKSVFTSASDNATLTSRTINQFYHLLACFSLK